MSPRKPNSEWDAFKKSIHPISEKPKVPNRGRRQSILKALKAFQIARKKIEIAAREPLTRNEFVDLFILEEAVEENPKVAKMKNPTTGMTNILKAFAKEIGANKNNRICKIDRNVYLFSRDQV